MYFTIYKITNNINGKYYIGKHQTKNIDDEYMGSGKLIQSAIKKYGIENFTKEILHICKTEEEMNLLEKKLVVISENTYNLCEGGKGGFSYIRNLPTHKDSCKKGGIKAAKIHRKKFEEDFDYRKKIMDTWHRAGIERSKEIRKRLYEEFGITPWTGHKHTDKTKKRMSKSAKGKHDGEKNSQYGTCWITNGIKDRKINKEELDVWLEKGYNKGRKVNCNQYQ